MLLNDLFWRGVAAVVSRPAVADYLIERSRKTPYENIYNSDDGSLYMERNWLFNPYEKIGGVEIKKYPGLPSIRIHHIMREDRDRHHHDHPWNARTIILKSFYGEERVVQKGFLRWFEKFTRFPGDTVTLKFGEYHRITYVPPDGVWTLFITGKYEGVWGFLVNGVKIPWPEYFNGRSKQ